MERDVVLYMSSIPCTIMLGGKSVLEPLMKEILNEHFRKRCSNQLVPDFWRHFEKNQSADVSLKNFLFAVDKLKSSVDVSSCTATIVDSLPGAQQEGSTSGGLLEILHASLSISQPSCLFEVVEDVFEHSLKLWEERNTTDNDDAEESMDADSATMEGYLEMFSKLTRLLRSLKLLHFFSDHAVAELVQKKVETLVHEQCSQEFDSPMLQSVIDSLQDTVGGWITLVYGDEKETRTQWLPQVQYFGYKTFAELRINELFDILVEFPDSKPSLIDLSDCLKKIDLRQFLITSLRRMFEKRLLHPGANTADIITQYISSIKGLRLLDPSGVILEQVCDPVRGYLRTREDTVRCIVASLVDDSSNELADELVTGEPVLVDLNEESDNEDQDFDSWEPDPIDADPTKTSKSRQTSDIISLLVNIYGSREMFVNEYRNLLADRLLQSLVYDTSREVRNLELLKLRFGESNLHFCEVMIKDIADSKRINTHVHSQIEKEEKMTAETSSDRPEVNAMVLSHVFWPTFREEKLKLPETIQQELDHYCKIYKSLKGMRTLEWKAHLGMVQVDLELADRELSLSVSPIRAAIVYKFQEQSSWTVDGLSSALEAQPSVVRRHLGFWVGQGVVREQPTDTFTVVEEQTAGAKDMNPGGETEDDEESAMASLEDQKESELQMFWAYIVGMLTSLGKMKLERIHSTLRMFAMQGSGGKDLSQIELKAFLERKVREQKLSVIGGEYQLPK